MSAETFGDLSPASQDLMKRVWSAVSAFRRATGLEPLEDHFVLRMSPEQWAGIRRRLRADGLQPAVEGTFLGLRVETPDDATEPELVCVWKMAL